MKPANEIFEKQLLAKARINSATPSERKEKLKRLLSKTLESREEIAEAIYSDFKKPKAETELTEILPLTLEIRNAIRNIKYWTRQFATKTPLVLFGSSGKTEYRPKGNVLIISPWNYPFLLAIGPLVSAIAAGNSVVVKPSELTPNTSNFIAEFLSEIFDESEVAVVQGGKETAQELLGLPFDHIFFTGGTAVGKIVMQAAAKNLSSITLELGGKSPVVIDDSANLKITAERVVWGKFLNAGQTCIAPDYVLIKKGKADEFFNYAKHFVNKFYGKALANSPEENLCNIVNEKNVLRLKFLLDDALGKGAEPILNNVTLDKGTFISPKIISNVPLESEIMQQEIFGPIMPVLFYKDFNEAVEIINKNPNPLSLYYFGKNKNNLRKLIQKVPAGGVVQNDVVVHFINYYAGFGGIRQSGFGKAHGFHGFKTFSNETHIMKQSRFSVVSMLYPPYTKLKKKILEISEKTL